VRRRARPAAAALVALALAGCGGGGGGSRRLTVLAASSLTEVFSELGRQFERAHPGVEVAFGFASSSSLAEQVVQGAPADVFAAADEASMARAVAAGRARDPRVVARNRLAIVVAPGNPAGLSSLADLARPGLVVVLCAPEAPCGRLAAAALDRAGVALEPASREPNVKAVVAKVVLGEADAGIAYETDVRAAGARVQGVAVAGVDDPSLEAVYATAVVAGTADAPLARSWVDFVASPAGQAALARAGFRTP